MAKPIAAVYEWLLPFRTFNSYGLFAVMTTSRPEIIVEGSQDGMTWVEYEFKHKPGDLKARATIRRATPAAAGLANVVRGAGRLPPKSLVCKFLRPIVTRFA